MKRLIHIITIVIIAIASLLAAIIIFLFIFYEVRDYKLSKAKADLSANHRKSRLQVAFIQCPEI
jgi:flagellar basal body-associated protein FliL